MGYAEYTWYLQAAGLACSRLSLIMDRSVHLLIYGRNIQNMGSVRLS